LLWGSGTNGRNDLGTFRNLGMNFVAFYDWSGGFCREHAPFLNAAWNSGTNPQMMTIPISNFNVDERVRFGNESERSVDPLRGLRA
jgi:hypothetical protein